MKCRRLIVAAVAAAESSTVLPIAQRAERMALCCLRVARADVAAIHSVAERRDHWRFPGGTAMLWNVAVGADFGEADSVGAASADSVAAVAADSVAAVAAVAERLACE